MAKSDSSLIFTVLNEAKTIERFLASLSALSQKPTHIVCVDGGSSDSTYRHLESWIPPEGVTLRLIQAQGLNIAQGRNLAIENCNDGIVMVADAGTLLDANWVKNLTIPFDNPRVDVVSGWFEPLPGTFWQSLIGSLTTPLLSEIDAASFLPSSRSVAFRKSAWKSVGGYPEWLDYCEDLIFGISLKSAGFNFVFASKAVVRWNARDSLSAFTKQYYRYARGDGKAGLWSKRHLARYSFYFAWLAAAAFWNSPVGVWLILLTSSSLIYYLLKFYRRLIVRRSAQKLDGFASSLLIAPIVVVIGDIAKMIGYPVGLLWRIQRKMGNYSD
jgi:cellulose synthase/poly-beta-1,6-N-acetylglucosamine synthase-like glycosyltransferase